MKTFVAVVVGQGKEGFVQSVHVAADSYRLAAALVLRQVRRVSGIKDFQIALRRLDEDTLQSRASILEASTRIPCNNPPPRRFAS